MGRDSTSGPTLPGTWRRVKISDAGEEPDQLREHQLSATAPGEPVMNESDAHREGVTSRSRVACSGRVHSMPARVLIDLRMVSGRLHGIARYALELARVLPALAPDLVFEGLGPPGGLAELGPLAPGVHRARGAGGRSCRPWSSRRWRRRSGGSNPSLFHATSFSVPLLWRGPLVATLHDAAHLVRGAEFGALTAAYYRLVVRPTVRRARGLLTVSEFARRELAGRLGVPESRWTVVPPGVDARFRPPTVEERLAVRARYGLPPRYLLAVGNPKPHKNLALLARIAARLPVPLVLLAGEAAGRVFPQPHPGPHRGRRGAAARAVRRRRGAPPPVAARGLRAPRARGDGHRDAGARRERRVAARGDRRRRRAARPRCSRGVDRRQRRARRGPGAPRPLGLRGPGAGPGLHLGAVRPADPRGLPLRRGEPAPRPTPARSPATRWGGRAGSGRCPASGSRSRRAPPRAPPCSPPGRGGAARAAAPRGAAPTAPGPAAPSPPRR